MEYNGGSIIGEVLARHGVPCIFTLCGGHISPILVGAKERGIKVVDVRDEVSSVFAADAMARMTGIPGVAAVTAGPGVTNTITAIKNAQMAQSPLLLFGGAAATVLKGRGSLQDIDQLSILKPITKWATSIKTVSAIEPTVEKAIEIATSGTPGPVFIEVPVDVLYPEALVKEWYLKESGVQGANNLGAKALELYLRGHLYRQFHAPHIDLPDISIPEVRLPRKDPRSQIEKAAELLRHAERPALVIGSQAMVNCKDPGPLAEAVAHLGVPTWLGGAARGLLGRHSDVQFRHKRTKALKAADVVIVAGFPFDFRMGYGRSIGSKATVIAANLSATELRMNRRPEVPIEMNAGDFLVELSKVVGSGEGRWGDWFAGCREREEARDAEIVAKGTRVSASDAGGLSESLVNPVNLFLALEQKMEDDSVLVVDGGDFVATAAYILRPRKPLCWLDPGVYGTLGVGGGFAVGAAMARPNHETWLIYGDGSSAYSLAEIDTCVRHGLAPILVVGTDASWAQIAREQGPILGDLVGTELLRTDYHKVVEGYGGVGLLLTDESKIDEVLDEAKAHAKAGRPVCINVHLASSDFRKGSLSM